ncbi:DnaJ domain-containing protein [Candidatus Acidulodesulfobacterium sp. H_13]|uniref:DnaJ domain-containing protein n=1 Tax=Candidatus Acidulodesulfobacterium sp. H_13 TaxID=3395470 RepID=UPI003AF712D6
MKNYYAILEIEKNASEELIKTSYRRLASIFHPDKNKENTGKFLDINEAYKTLSNPFLRESYDKQYKQPNERAGTADVATSCRKRLRDGANIFIDAYFADSITGQANYAQSNADNLVDDESIIKTFKVTRYIVCPECEGEGKQPGTLAVSCIRCNGYGVTKNPETNLDEICQNCNGYGDVFMYKCQNCNGLGRIRANEEISLKFNANDILIDGKIITFKNIGDIGIFGGKNGDLIARIRVNVVPKNTFLKRLFLKYRNRL